jgi:hypothetical protein
VAVSTLREHPVEDPLVVLRDIRMPRLRAQVRLSRCCSKAARTPASRGRTKRAAEHAPAAGLGAASAGAATARNPAWLEAPDDQRQSAAPPLPRRAPLRPARRTRAWSPGRPGPPTTSACAPSMQPCSTPDLVASPAVHAGQELWQADCSAHLLKQKTTIAASLSAGPPCPSPPCRPALCALLWLAAFRRRGRFPCAGSALPRCPGRPRARCERSSPAVAPLSARGVVCRTWSPWLLAAGCASAARPAVRMCRRVRRQSSKMFKTKAPSSHLLIHWAYSF